jgi:hypothetical protein
MPGNTICMDHGKTGAMPSWSKKDERQYEHIKQSAQERGTKVARAKEIAAAR